VKIEKMCKKRKKDEKEKEPTKKKGALRAIPLGPSIE